MTNFRVDLRSVLELMEENNSYPHVAMQLGSFRHTMNIPDLSEEGLCKSRFYKAFTSLGRAEGVCQLTLIWQRENHSKSLEAHHYLLCFNHQGIKDYWLEDITSLGVRGWQKRTGYKTVQLLLPEAVSLIQDAYAQNLRFKTKTALGIDGNHMLLEYDSMGVERSLFSYRLFPGNIDLRMFVNIYLAAVKRLDRSLLYDLASSERQSRLGDRTEYLTETEDELSLGTFLRYGVTSVESQGRINQVDAYAVISTPQEEIVRINYKLQILGEKCPFYVLDFNEVGREILAAAHPENPLNYQVFTTLYRHKGKEEVRQWLEKQRGVFLGGELPHGEFFKWLNGGSEPWEEFNFSQAISAEFILSDNELLVFSQRAERLAGIIRLLAEDLRGLLVVQDQYHLEVSHLFRVLFNTEHGGNAPSLAPQLKANRAQSFILHVELMDRDNINAYVSKIAVRTVRLGLGANYHLIKKDRLLVELYSVGCWLKLIIYSGSWEEELSFLKSHFKIREIISDHEMENRFDLFTPPLTEQRKWEISQQLLILSKEAVLIKDMGLVPSVREVGQRLGVVV